MSAAIIAAAVGAAALTAASLLAYWNARAAQREAERTDIAGLNATVDVLSQTLRRTEEASGRSRQPSSGCANASPQSKGASTPCPTEEPDAQGRAVSRPRSGAGSRDIRLVVHPARHLPMDDERRARAVIALKALLIPYCGVS